MFFSCIYLIAGSRDGLLPFRVFLSAAQRPAPTTIFSVYMIPQNASGVNCPRDDPMTFFSRGTEFSAVVYYALPDA
ncbi:MAG TPA: hypothetical protein DEW22_02600 [Clostridiales bacterium]|nr:hypothetical protein [Clostridiales bacterium]